MRILLIEPDHQCGLNPFPWGVLSLGSYLKQEGHDVDLLCASLLTGEKFEREFDRLLPEAELLGVSLFSTDTHWVLRLMECIRRMRPKLPVIIGGPHAILLPEQTASFEAFEYLAFGPGEETTAGLARALAGEMDMNEVAGLIHKVDGRIVTNRPAGPPPDYPIDYELLPERKRATFGDYFEVLAGRGCSFSCAFCYNAVCGHKWIGKPAETLVDEIQDVVDRYDPKLIYFRDENFFHSKKRVRRFVELYRERGFTFHWHATCRANYFGGKYIDRNMLGALRDAGCVKLKFGMESGSQRVLEILHKGIKVKHIRDVAESLSQSNIVGNYSFLTAVPGETRDDLHQTLRIIEEIVSKDPAAEIIGPQFYRIYPGGELYERIVAEYGYRPPESFEAWAEAVRDDLFGLSKDVDHPWMTGGLALSRLADIMVLLRRKPLSELMTPLKLPALPFALLARARMRLGFFHGMLDMRLAAWLFRKYVENIYLARALD